MIALNVDDTNVGTNHLKDSEQRITMETDNLSNSNDSMAVVTVEPAPGVVAMTMDDRSGIVTDHETATSSGQSASSNLNGSSTPSKKAAVAERELRQPFPVKVYEMLENAEKKHFSHIVSWNESGNGFMVHDKDHFTKEIVPHYFNLTKYKSFQRQVSPISKNSEIIVNSSKNL